MKERKKERKTAKGKRDSNLKMTKDKINKERKKERKKGKKRKRAKGDGRPTTKK